MSLSVSLVFISGLLAGSSFGEASNTGHPFAWWRNLRPSPRRPCAGAAVRTAVTGSRWNGIARILEYFTCIISLYADNRNRHFYT